MWTYGSTPTDGTTVRSRWWKMTTYGDFHLSSSAKWFSLSGEFYQKYLHPVLLLDRAHLAGHATHARWSAVGSSREWGRRWSVCFAGVISNVGKNLPMSNSNWLERICLLWPAAHPQMIQRIPLEHLQQPCLVSPHRRDMPFSSSSFFVFSQLVFVFSYYERKKETLQSNETFHAWISPMICLCAMFSFFLFLCAPFFLQYTKQWSV